jgi:cobaltochelatase CobS
MNSKDDAHNTFVEKATKSIASKANDMKANDYRRLAVDAIGNFYMNEFAHAEIYSPKAKQMIEDKRLASLRSEPAVEETEAEVSTITGMTKTPIYKAFGLTRSKTTRNGAGEELEVDVMPKGHDYQYMTGKVDGNYVWDVDLLKIIMMSSQENLNMYVWGHAGVGKSTCIEQFCASSNRPYVRIQHTGSTEESHIVGQMLANEKGTYFSPGPLAMAMRNGWVYIADEYDFAFPQVIAVYQPVLEGKALYIKEADEEWRVVEPHPNFRFFATGNTNGAGDETGLYQGTNMQNAASYERFAVVLELKFMDVRKETKLVSQKVGIDKELVAPIIQFVTKIREAYDMGKITYTAGQRVTINIAKIYVLRGRYMDGANLSFINRLPESDRNVATEIAKRIFAS